MMPLTAALVISNRSLWEQVHACIQNLPVRIALEQNEPDDVDSLLDRIEKHRADVVLIEAHRLALPLEDFIGRLRDTASQPAVFVLHPDASPQHIMEAIRAGAAEFLYPPVGDRLREAFEKLSEVRSKSSNEPSSGLGKVFGFLSATGGCGATTFACHVATDAAKQLKQPVLLADFDFEAGLIRFVLKSKSAYSVRDALDNMHRMDSSYWKALVSSHPDQLDVIPAPDDLAAKRAPVAQEMAHLLRFIRSVYPLTIVDFGRHFSVAALDSLPELEALYLLATFDLETLDRAKDCIRVVGERGYAANRLKVLLNRMPERNAPDPKGFESFLGVPHSGVFSSDSIALYDAWSEGHLLEPNTKLGRELHAVAESIVARTRGERADAKKAEPAPGGGGVKRLFSFLQRSKE
jgi:pilus assembly protein CpaE